LFIKAIGFEYRYIIYDIFNLYEVDYYPKKFNSRLAGKPKQLITYKKMHISMEPRNSEKYDYKCVRNGTAKIFVAMELKVGKGLTQNQKKNHNGFETIREDSLYRKIGANEI